MNENKIKKCSHVVEKPSHPQGRIDLGESSVHLKFGGRGEMGRGGGGGRGESQYAKHENVAEKPRVCVWGCM